MMRIWTKRIYRLDGSTDQYVPVDSESSSFLYGGVVALCKGDSTAQSTEQLQQENLQQQMAYNQQLMNIFGSQFANQQNVLNYVQSKMQPMIDNPTGYTQQQLTSMRTSSDDNLSTQYQNAQKALNQSEFANGSRDLPSGVNDQLNASLLNSEATDKASAQNQITQANANLQQQNYWNAVNVLNGVGAEYNPQSYASAATNAADAANGAGNSVANLSNAYTNSQQSGLMGVLGGVTSGIFGAAGQAGGFSSLFCYVAAAVFNEPPDLTGPKTTAVRSWMLAQAKAHWYARPLVWLYSRTSKWIALHPWMVRLLAPLFRLFLRKAQEVK